MWSDRVLTAEDISGIIARTVRETLEAVGIRPAAPPPPPSPPPVPSSASPPAPPSPGQPPSDPDALLTRDDGAAALTAAGYATASRTLSTLASRGTGPLFRRFGKRTVYRWGDLLAWAEGRVGPPVRSAAEARRAAAARRAAGAVPPTDRK
jgi:hypothetical protein